MYGSGSRSSAACSSVWARISRVGVSTTTREVAAHLVARRRSARGGRERDDLLARDRARRRRRRRPRGSSRCGSIARRRSSVRSWSSAVGCACAQSVTPPTAPRQPGRVSPAAVGQPPHEPVRARVGDRLDPAAGGAARWRPRPRRAPASSVERAHLRQVVLAAGPPGGSARSTAATSTDLAAAVAEQQRRGLDLAHHRRRRRAAPIGGIR